MKRTLVGGLSGHLSLMLDGSIDHRNALLLFISFQDLKQGGGIPLTSKKPDPPRIYRISSSSCKCLSSQLYPQQKYSLIEERLDLVLICFTQSFGSYRYSISLTNQLNPRDSQVDPRFYIPLLWQIHLLVSLCSNRHR
jgi:hypothetical protein